jgi:hypothetical protein
MPASKFTRFTELNQQISCDTVENLDVSDRLQYTIGLPQSNRRGHTYVVGSFTCTKKSCGKSWDSGRVFTEIYFTPLNADTMVHAFDVLVWSQQCRACESIAAPELDEAIYMERIASKLQLYMGARAPMIPTKDEKQTRPHRKELCCVCKAGKCEEESGRRGWNM